MFWAVNLPEEIKLKLSDIRDRLQTAGADARWVEPGNLHVTVKFLGDTDAGLVAQVADSAVRCLRGFNTFRLDVGGLGFFPGPSGPRVLWAGLKGEVAFLREAARKVEDAMAPLGFPREARKFSPHLTLARIKSSRGAAGLVKAVEAEKSRVENLGGFKVAAVDLMQSGLTPRGPVYTLLASVKLGIGN